MISISDTHPDLEKFITVKSDLNKVNYANISVRISDAFMKAVMEDRNWNLEFERKETDEAIVKMVKAKDIYKKLCEQNWNYAEPGMLFWDRINNYNLLSNTKSFAYAGVNPCAEEPLPAGGSCNLGALNLSAFVENGEFNFKEFGKAVRIAVRCQNQILEEGEKRHPLKEQRESVNKYKQIGVGLMGLADMLIKLKIKYGSDQSIEFCDKIGTYLNYYGIKESITLGKKFGSFKSFNADEVFTTTYWKQQLLSFKAYGLLMEERPTALRNSQLFTIAPTGTISTMGVQGGSISGGVEPIFANYYERTTKSLHGTDVKYKVYTPIVKQFMEQHHLKDDSQLPDYFVTSAMIPIEDRIKMQAIWQKHIDASISSTVNLPNEATIQDVENLYLEAWRQGLKGITVYRAGCAREGILVATPKKEPNPTIEEKPALKRGDIIECSSDLIGRKDKIISGCGSLHVLAFFNPIDGALMEVYLSKGSTGGCSLFMVGLSRTISLLCRAGVNIFDIVDQLDSTGACPSYAVRRATKHDTSPGSCCPMAIGKKLLEMYQEVQIELFGEEDKKENKKVEKPIKVIPSKALCPECGEPLIFEGGCNSCKNCGYSKCS